MDKFEIEERRRYPRMKESIFFHYQFRREKGGDIIKGFTEDISAGGLMFETERTILNQEVLNLEMYQPSSQSQREIISIPILAKVKWMTKIVFPDKHQEANKNRVGVEFIQIGHNQRKAIAEFVQGKLSA